MLYTYLHATAEISLLKEYRRRILAALASQVLGHQRTTRIRKGFEGKSRKKVLYGHPMKKDLAAPLHERVARYVGHPYEDRSGAPDTHTFSEI